MEKSNADTNTLTVRQLTAIEFLATNTDVIAVSKELGASKKTLYAWLKEPAFKTELATRRTQMLDHAMQTVKTQTQKAVSKIVTLLNSENESIALKAACFLLDKAIQCKEIEELERRLVQIEIKIQNNTIKQEYSHEIHSNSQQIKQN